MDQIMRYKNRYSEGNLTSKDVTTSKRLKNLALVLLVISLVLGMFLHFFNSWSYDKRQQVLLNQNYNAEGIALLEEVSLSRIDKTVLYEDGELTVTSLEEGVPPKAYTVNDITFSPKTGRYNIITTKPTGRTEKLSIFLVPSREKFTSRAVLNGEIYNIVYTRDLYEQGVDPVHNLLDMQDDGFDMDIFQKYYQKETGETIQETVKKLTNEDI